MKNRVLSVAMLLLIMQQAFLFASESAAAGPEDGEEPLLPGSAPGQIAAFSDPARIWGNGVERVIEEAYRLCFKTRIIGGRVMNLRMPFAENNERDLLSDTGWEFLGGGKGNPEMLWPVIESILDSGPFAEYAETLSGGREQVIIFDMPTQSWRSSRDLFDIARMKAGSYRGLPHRPYVLVSGQGIEDADVYNYLYCIGLAGMDCSGFVWHVLSYTGKQGGLDLGKTLSRVLGVPRGGDPAWYVGTSFFGSKSAQIVTVADQIRNIRPADIILFRGSGGEMAHSAVVQSVDFSNGVIRYLQSTDEAPLHERGVHESFVYFDPSRPELSLGDTSLNWTQKRYAPFPGEKDSPFSDDGGRYRAFANFGGGKVVRLKALGPVIEKLNRGTIKN
ncbi:MAG: peptidoglycan endopeptidase [Treponema sp.]|jgi:hypothetical protein|nr:peptidoglycan endopeptidase [Treponema sp.]